MTRLKRYVRTALLAVVGGYCGLLVILYFAQDALLFPAPVTARTPSGHGGALLRIKGPFGEAFATWWAAPEGQPTLVFFHGNGEQLADDDTLAQDLRQRQLGFLGVEYPGYGLARGQPLSEASIDAVAETVLQHLAHELHVPPERTVLVGFSLGTGVAAEMALRGLGSRLILLAPYTSIPDVGARDFPLFPVRLLARNRFDTASRAPRIRQPTLIVHGTDDRVVPFALGRAVAPLFPNASFEPVQGAGHLDLFCRAAVLDRIAAFARGAALLPKTQ